MVEAAPAVWILLLGLACLPPGCWLWLNLIWQRVVGVLLLRVTRCQAIVVSGVGLGSLPKLNHPGGKPWLYVGGATFPRLRWICLLSFLRAWFGGCAAEEWVLVGGQLRVWRWWSAAGIFLAPSSLDLVFFAAGFLSASD